MTTEMTLKPENNRAARIAGIVGLLLLVAGASETFANEADDGTRVTRSGGALTADGPDGANTALEEAEHETQPTLVTAGKRTSPGKTQSGPNALALHTGFWVYDARSELRYDYDGDGYYHHLRVTFDADTDFASARVYARLFLSLEGGPWNHYFTTGDFTIYGTSSTDDYEVATELVSGYPRGQYDVLIELYDADFDDLVAEFGPLESSALSLLPLEDQGRDATVSAPAPTVSRSSGGGGSLTWLLLALPALALRRRLR